MDDGPRRIVDRGHYVAPIFALAAIGGALAFTYASLGIHLIQQWRDDDTYSHGFIVVPSRCILRGSAATLFRTQVLVRPPGGWRFCGELKLTADPRDAAANRRGVDPGANRASRPGRSPGGPGHGGLDVLPAECSRGSPFVPHQNGGREPEHGVYLYHLGAALVEMNQHASARRA